MMTTRTTFQRILAMALSAALCLGAAPLWAQAADDGVDGGQGGTAPTADSGFEYDSGWAMALPVVAFKAVTMNTAYIDANGNQQSVVATQIHDPTVLLTSGWYFVMGEVDTVNLTVSGDAHIIILDGSSLSATATGDNAGIRVHHTDSLSIYGQALGTGSLSARGSGKGAGIGGNGGKPGDDWVSGGDGGTCGTVKIVSGKVTATSVGGGEGGNGTASAAGGGNGGGGGKVTVYGGSLTVSGIIGGGNGGSSVYKYGGEGMVGGTLTVMGGVVNAGRIGGGNGGDGQSYSSGGRKGGDGGSVIVSGGSLTARQIGGGDAGDPGYLLSSLTAKGGNGGSVVISGGVVNVTGLVGGGKGSFNLASLAGGAGSVTVTGGSAKLAGLQPTPTNGSTNGSQVLLATDAALDGVTSQTAVIGVLTGTGYTYGTNELLTGSDGSMRLWLPAEAEISLVQTADKGYTGSIGAGSSGTLIELPPDTQKPAVVTVSPADGAVDVPAAGKLVVTFNEMMKTSVGSLTLSGDGETPLVLSGTWSYSNRTYTASYSGLTLGDNYTVGISGFCDLSGNEMQSENSRVFTVVPPVVLPKFDYIDENGTLQTVGATKIDGSFAGLTAGWYAVEGAVNVTNMTVTGNVNLIFTDGAQLTATATGNNAGVRVTAGNALTIYAQTNGTGALTATGAGKGAGIGGYGGVDGSERTSGAGGGTLVLVGGKVTTGRIGGGAGGHGAGFSPGGAKGGSGGTLVVHGGSLTAAGIGGGNGGNGTYPSMGGDGGDGTAITINGGVVNVSGKVGGGTAGTGTSVPFGFTAKNGGAGSCVITGGSVTVGSMQPVPTNGSALGGKKVVRSAVNLMGLAAITPISRMITDAGYTYGTNGMATDVLGKFYPWLPVGTTTFYAATPEQPYTGAVATGVTGRLQPIKLDTTPPTLQSIVPNNGADGLPVSGSIVLTFSEMMDGLSGRVTLSTAGTAAENLTGGVWTVQNRVFTVEYAYLELLTSYIVNIKDFVDASGNAMAATAGTTFTIGSDPGPMPGSSGSGNNSDDSEPSSDSETQGTFGGGGDSLPTAKMPGAFGTPGVSSSFNVTVDASIGQTGPQAPGASPQTSSAGPVTVINEQIMVQAIQTALANAPVGTPTDVVVQANVKTAPGTDSLTTTLTQNSLQQLTTAGVSGFAIIGGPVDIALNGAALREIGRQSAGLGALIVTMQPASGFAGASAALIGGRPAYDVTIHAQSANGNQIISNLVGGTATIAIPYTPQTGESTGGLLGIFVNQSGTPQPVTDSYYDPERQCIVLAVGHFSTFGVGYKTPVNAVEDIKGHWAEESVDFVLARGLMTASGSAFAPETPLTREALAAALGRLAEAGTSSTQAIVPADVAHDSESAPVISWIVQNKVMHIDKDGKFLPNAAVTREEMAAIVQRFANAAGIALPEVRFAAQFSDENDISRQNRAAVTAMQRAGIVTSMADNRFDPASPATRAQAAALLQRLVKRGIDPASAQGWSQNDDGTYFYYYNGTPLTGRHEISGTEFVFYADGTLHNGWQSDAVGNRYFIMGNQVLTGLWDIGTANDLWRCSFDEKGRLISRVRPGG